MRNPRPQIAVLALSLAASSCWFKKAPSVFTPPSAQAAPVSAPADPASLPSAPQIETDPSATKPPAPSETMPKAEGEIPARPRPPRRTGTAPTRTPPGATAPANGTQTDPVPPRRLGQIYTAEQVREYNKSLEESLDRVKKALGALEGKRLSTGQLEIVTRIRTFQKQAEQAREEDLVTAVNLARRADILAKDLLERLP